MNCHCILPLPGMIKVPSSSFTCAPQSYVNTLIIFGSTQITNPSLPGQTGVLEKQEHPKDRKHLQWRKEGAIIPFACPSPFWQICGFHH